MAYCTVTDITRRLPSEKILQLCDDERLVSNYKVTYSVGVAQNASISTRVTEAIDDADGEINGYIRQRFVPPVVDADGNTPRIIKNASVAMSIYNLHMRRRSEMEVPKQVLRDYDRQVKILEDIYKGIIDPGVEPQPTESEAVAAEYIDGGDDPLFTRDTLEDF